MAMLKVNKVSITYGSLIAVKDISFEVDEGEYICVVGYNGSGKSSLIKGIFGLVPLSSGSTEFAIPMEHVAYLPQTNLAERHFPATVNEVVLTGTQKKARRLPFYSKADIKNAEEAMKLLNIFNLKNKRIGELSGGQQQRAMLARVLCRKPKMLILDEPCAGLDPEITKEFYALLADLNENQGIAILMASHDLTEIQKHAKRIISVGQTLRFDGNVEEWLAFSGREGNLCS